ncbi:MAG: hypothetical protein HQM09_20395 [Candidatus Riflebacteria bacterium]|nr:hypothetical protein [Candidatus Riflebacteria bacterium]
MISARKQYILFATIGYAFFSALWIILSDQLLSVFVDVSAIAWLSTMKGIAFVLVTTMLLYFALKNIPDKSHTILSSNGPIYSSSETVLAISATASRMPRWILYVFALILTLTGVFL